MASSQGNAETTEKNRLKIKSDQKLQIWYWKTCRYKVIWINSFVNHWSQKVFTDHLYVKMIFIDCKIYTNILMKKGLFIHGKNMYRYFDIKMKFVDGKIYTYIFLCKSDIAKWVQIFWYKNDILEVK